MPMDEHELYQRDAKRDIGAELLVAIRDVKAGRYGRVHAISLRTGGGAPASTVGKANSRSDRDDI